MELIPISKDELIRLQIDAFNKGYKQAKDELIDTAKSLQAFKTFTSTN